MSGADGQRGAESPSMFEPDGEGGIRYVDAETHIDRLRAELAETRNRRDYLQGQLDIVYDAEYSRNDALKRRIEKLTAELAENRAGGDELAAAAVLATVLPRNIEQDEMVKRDGGLKAALATWRSVRGGAPTQPPAAPRELPFREDDLAEGMQRAWNDVVGDVGHIPEDFTVRPRTAKVTADFLGGSFARSVLGYLQSVAAAPAVARTDRQPTIPLVRDQAVDTIVAFAHRNADNEDGYVRVLNALGDLGVADDEIDRARPDLDEDAQDDARLTAEQYRHIYVDLIRGLAVDLGLDPEKAGGGSVTAAVRRLVAGVSVPQKSTESTAGDTAALAVQVWQSDDSDWGWACARCDYRSVAWWSDRTVAERAAVEHGRDHCRAGGSAPASTDTTPEDNDA